MGRDATTTSAAAVKRLFLEALDASRDERAALLADAPPEVRDGVEALLRSHDEAASGDFDRLTFTLDWSSLAPDAPGRGPGFTADQAIGDYVLRERLGRGGHGEVWRADQLRPVERAVAIKFLTGRGGDDGKLARRFAFERQALARLDHPDIARVLDAGDAGGVPYLVVELAPGRPITDFCFGEQLDVDERIALFARVCDAVAHAHARGLLHCDLKPTNVLVWRDANEHDVRLKVIDFGIARLLGAEDAEGVVGTPAFMSPEQADDGAIDVRSDVYALGLLLHALLGGVNPVVDAATTKSRRALVKIAASSPRPAALEGPVPREADWIIARATAPEPDDRYETVARLADDVKRALDGRPIGAGPRTLSYFAKRHAARNKPLAAAIAVAAMILFGGVAATAYQAVRATRAEQQALEDRDAAEATSRFLQRVLFSARPNFEDAEARQAFLRAVNRARDGLAIDLRGRPEVRSELLDMIGMIYFESGRYEEAQPLLEEAYTLRRDLFGPTDRRTLRSHEQYANTFRFLEQFDEAIELASEAVRLGEQVGLTDDQVILRNARLTVSDSALRRRAPGDLERLRGLAVDARRRSSGETSLDARQHLARLVLNYADGVLSFEEAHVPPASRTELAEFIDAGHELVADLPMDASPAMLQLRHLHASLLARSGRWYDALQIYKELIPLINEHLPADDDVSLTAYTSFLSLRAIYETRDAPPEQVEEIAADLQALFERGRTRRFVYGFVPLSMVLWNAGRFEEVRDVALEVEAMGPEQSHLPAGGYEQAAGMLAELRRRRPDLFDTATTQPAADDSD